VYLVFLKINLALVQLLLF